MHGECWLHQVKPILKGPAPKENKADFMLRGKGARKDRESTTTLVYDRKKMNDDLL